ncbi:hypothetical protein BD310DRAFT_515924 [Dichomitus squalens]|uniref:Uncharacterized protein n=1 Tax=Dichomitus squalens TaxID=114155 RepID=A0A4Q9PTW1_9APHY|nr:hypothetical protein BD310DRAFT_515924 [Dichomitus squalens]
MPIRGANHSPFVSDDAPFFRSLADLDQWAASPSSAIHKHYGVLPFTPRSDVEGVSNRVTRGKLLVCHDYKVRLPDSLS